MAIEDISRYELDRAAATARRSENAGPIENLFFKGNKRGLHKWLHYLPVYDRYFAPYRGKPVRMLEIGVNRGGSIDLWRDYFGADATIFGIDIDPSCATAVTAPNQVRIGSQADPAFLASVVAEMGTPDIILDDGSHIGEHQLASFHALFPALANGGVYVVEDLHTSYWQSFGGGMRKQGSGVEMIKTLIDDLHAWYHDDAEVFAPRDQIGAIHSYDSISVIEKKRRLPPAHFVSQTL